MEGRKEKGNFEREKEGQQLEQTERGKDRDDVNEVAAAARLGGGAGCAGRSCLSRRITN